MIKNKDLKELINEIEKQYPVNEWKFNGYKLWPIIRIRLFFLLKKKYDFRPKCYQKNISIKNYRKSFLYLKEFISTGMQYLNLKKPIDAIFCGAPSYRVQYQNYKYNRYFDPIIDDSSKEVLFVEYNSINKYNYYKSERIFLFKYLCVWFKIFGFYKKKEISNTQFIAPLVKILETKGYSIPNLEENLEEYIVSTDVYRLIWTKVLEKMQPKEVRVLCYYSPMFFGLNIAAHELEIKTIDMQHGPQGEFHLAYGSWLSVPREGYEALPNEFHEWNEFSAKYINEWANNTSKHSAKITGNPWIEGWRNKLFDKTGYSYPDNLILYTLQPIDEPLEPYLLKAMDETKDKYNWWLRVHPRQLNEVDAIKKKLSDNGLLEHINLEDATRLPLPEILLSTKVHLTKSSGCAIEAFCFGIPTILISKGGKEYYSDYLSEDKLMTFSLNKNSHQLIKKLYEVINNN